MLLNQDEKVLEIFMKKKKNHYNCTKWRKKEHNETFLVKLGIIKFINSIFFNISNDFNAIFKKKFNKVQQFYRYFLHFKT